MIWKKNMLGSLSLRKTPRADGSRLEKGNQGKYIELRAIYIKKRPNKSNGSLTAHSMEDYTILTPILIPISCLICPFRHLCNFLLVPPVSTTCLQREFLIRIVGPDN